MLRSCRQILRESNRNSDHPHPCKTLPILYYPLNSPKSPGWRWPSPWRDLLTYASPAKKDPTRNITELFYSFPNWFLRPEIVRRNEQMQTDVQNICNVLHSRGHNVIEDALAKLRLRLTEECVIKVLKKLDKDEALLGVRFFDWAGRQTNYRHTSNAYYALYKMFSRTKLTGMMLDWLDSFRKQENVRRDRFYETLIMGYALAGQSDVALQMFARMRFQGLDLESIGYNALLNGLIKENCFDVVDVIYKHVSISRGRFRNRNPGSIDCIMMRNLCKQGRLEEARQLLDKLRENGGTEVEYAVCILVSSFCIVKRIDEARALVEEMKKEPKVSMSKVYNVWIRGLVGEKRVDEALIMFEAAKASQSFVPGHSCYNALVSGLLKNYRIERFYFLRENRLEKVDSLLNEMKKHHIFPDSYTMNELVCFFCQRGAIDIALELYNGISKIGFSPGSVTHDALINALCRARKLDEALRVLEEVIVAGLSPSKQTFFPLVKYLHKNGKLDEMQEVIDAGFSRQCAPRSTSSCSTFIFTLCNAGKVDDRVLVPRKLWRRYALLNKNTYSGLIHGFCLVKRGEMASKVLLEMQEYGHCPSRYILRTVIRVLCETGHSDQVLQLLDMHVSGQPPKASLYNAFINGLCNAGHPDIASLAFKKMEENGCPPITNTYVALLNGYVKCKELVDALEFFHSLSAVHSPCTRLYSILISGCLKAGKLEGALSFWGEMTGKGLIPKLLCCEDLIYILCMVGLVNGALSMFSDVKAKGGRSSTYIYNVILVHLFKVWREDKWFKVIFQLLNTQGDHPITGALSMSVCGLSNTRNLESILRLLEEVIEELFVPNVVTYNILIGVLCKELNMEAACNIFNNMSKKGCTPDAWTYDILVHGFCKAHRRNEAQVFMEEMIKKGFNPSVWTYDLFRSLANK